METHHIRVLLADDNIDFCNGVTDYINKQPDMEIVSVVHNGVDACEQIELLRPDVAILDGAMPLLDGLGVLEQLKDNPLKPICIMLSSMNHDSVAQYAYSLGAEYFIIKPFEMTTLAHRIRLFYDINTINRNTNTSPVMETKPKPTQSLEEQVEEVLSDLGIPIHIRGFRYLCMAVILVTQNPEILYYVTKELYPAIAKNCNVSTSSVERAIRNAIDIAWSHDGSEKVSRLFGQSYNVYKNKPTNTEFIALVSGQMRFKR